PALVRRARSPHAPEAIDDGDEAAGDRDTARRPELADVTQLDDARNVGSDLAPSRERAGLHRHGGALTRDLPLRQRSPARGLAVALGRTCGPGDGGGAGRIACGAVHVALGHAEAAEADDE